MAQTVHEFKSKLKSYFLLHVMFSVGFYGLFNCFVQRIGQPVVVLVSACYIPVLSLGV